MRTSTDPNARDAISRPSAGSCEMLNTLAVSCRRNVRRCDTVVGELRRLGWALRPRPTSRHDEDHLASDPDPTPVEQGERRAPVGPDETRWEERAHEEADAGERLYPGRPGASGATTGKDPEERAHPSS